MPLSPLPHLSVIRYGSVILENEYVPCVLASDSNIYVPILGVCQVVGGQVDQEEDRIVNDEALRDGAAYLPFIIQAGTKTESVEMVSISYTRLHTWLNGIALEEVPDEDMRQKLLAMKRELADLVYGYFGRPMIPPDIKAELDHSLSEDKRNFYATTEELYKITHELDGLKDTVEALKQEVQSLKASVSLDTDRGDFIDMTQQQQYKAIIGILGRLAEEKKTGGFDTVQEELKRQFGFTYYKAITSEQWEPVIRYCIQMHNSLTRNAPLPRVLELALKTRTQRNLF